MQTVHAYGARPMYRSAAPVFCESSSFTIVMRVNFPAVSRPFVFLLFTICCGSNAAAQIVVDCGNPFENAYGPFDYRTATDQQKKTVESYHFTTSVETLKAGTTSALGGDIDYTLRAFP